MAYTPSYIKRNYVNGQAPAISASNLNAIEKAITDVEQYIATLDPIAIERLVTTGTPIARFTIDGVSVVICAPSGGGGGGGDDKMDKVDPTGFGSFSLNRMADSPIGINSFAEGNNTEASGKYSHAEGYNTIASGEASHAEGYYWTTASGKYSHAEGYYSRATGNRSHAEGNNTEASGDYSHAECSLTHATGEASHAEGSYTVASGKQSHAEGYYTAAASKYQHVEGKYNVADANNKYAHIIGNGTSEYTRSNAFTVDWDGNVECQGSLTQAHPSYEISASSWVANSDSSTNTDYPYIYTVSASGMTATDVPICQLFGTGTVTTQAEMADIALVQEIVSGTDALTLYATGLPTNNLVLQTIGK